jgi:hypothetical protein
LLWSHDRGFDKAILLFGRRLHFLVEIGGPNRGANMIGLMRKKNSASLELTWSNIAHTQD